jgi:bifunctional UDP-N-acetylglucosamine pyrophosphorylase/glucosamine-1-phosphate N-acetyltransferase
VFGTGVEIGDNVEIRAFSHIEGAVVANGCTVGPFARLRPGTKLGKDNRVGNFVEIKNATTEADVKISHLSYIGDASIGENTNIGAGTITCNYDGYNKFYTDIGKDCFIGSNSCLIAPVKVGDGAIIGAGSTITSDIDSHALGLARAEQKVLENKAKEYREKRQAKKKTKKA